ncbi:MAG: lysophospholipase [Candidatus Omnitrophica bacterium]|nr:lysophospholipase [Candidatus Omnitrophota bacterium]
MSEVSCQEGTWIEPSSKRSYHYRWWRGLSAQKLVVILHGFGEHSGRYHSFACALAEEGMNVAAPDWWAHGLSGGKRGDLGEVVEDVRRIWRMIDEVFLPKSGQGLYVLFGHSFGGLGAILLALNHPLKLQRLIVQSPLLEVGFPLPQWKAAMAALLFRCWPTVSLSMQLDASALSHDPRVVEAYRTDPLVHGFMSARTYRAILQARNDVLKRTAPLAVPTLLLCGLADRIISVEVAQRWFDQLACKKRRVIFPDAAHELHHEPIRTDVIRLVREWVTMDEVPSEGARC